MGTISVMETIKIPILENDVQFLDNASVYNVARIFLEYKMNLLADVQKYFDISVSGNTYLFTFTESKMNVLFVKSKTYTEATSV